jgi:hypothetical protein
MNLQKATRVDCSRLSDLRKTLKIYSALSEEEFDIIIRGKTGNEKSSPRNPKLPTPQQIYIGRICKEIKKEKARLEMIKQ